MYKLFIIMICEIGGSHTISLFNLVNFKLMLFKNLLMDFV